ncbi:YkvA family protein [Paenibacillus aurantius]|uniref:YkvA family protein n=1 Tax=Paenibacillus aurantius TaxID=2918900 RepID=A0AA96LG22_9BACL|nr:YkvA family protein [Paenibacillus aurantius]WNQ12638.1 YkvA family protein [Paenibacillus aurantius]
MSKEPLLPAEPVRVDHQLTRYEHQTDEEYVNANFWAKMKKSASKIPFMLDAVAMFYAATDPKTPKWAKAVAFGGLAYFILPIDVIPDFLLIAGWTDDAAILAATLKTLASRVTDEHRQKAREWADGEKHRY